MPQGASVCRSMFFTVRKPSLRPQSDLYAATEIKLCSVLTLAMMIATWGQNTAPESVQQHTGGAEQCSHEIAKGISGGRM